MPNPLKFSSVFLRGLPLVLWMIVIFSFSSLPGSENPSSPTPWFLMERKGAHVLEYAILMLLWAHFLSLCLPQAAPRKKLLIAGLLSILYAATDEWHQSFVPYRGAKISDVAIDMLGILSAGAVLWFAARRRARKK